MNKVVHFPIAHTAGRHGEQGCGSFCVVYRRKKANVLFYLWFRLNWELENDDSINCLVIYYFKCQIVTYILANTFQNAMSEIKFWIKHSGSSACGSFLFFLFFIILVCWHMNKQPQKYLREMWVSTSCHLTRQTRMFSSSFASYHYIGLDVSSQ